MEIALVNPEIPQNSGNIGRLCVATNSKLHFVGKLGFSISDKHLKRAGLDYWKSLDYQIWDSFDDFYTMNQDKNFYFATSKGEMIYTDVSFRFNDIIVFGSESKGFDDKILKPFPDNQKIKIPFKNVRCLNLSNSVSIILYEALRQLDFEF